MAHFFQRMTLLWPDPPVATLIVASVVALGLVLLVVRWVVKQRRNDARAASLNVRSSQPTDPAGLAAFAAEREENDSRALLALAQELLGATTSEQLREVIARHLPPLLGSRRVWISTQIRGRRRVLVDDRGEGEKRELLDIQGQEWTTFPLRIGRELIGLLGVESEGGLKPHVKQFVRLAVPLIAQAVNAVDQFETLRETSLVDLLTGTATRREGLTRLGAEIKRAQRTGSSMAVLMLDLDHFKSINDQFGHAIGDAVLTEVGRTLQRTLRASDSRSRWGGEEFLIVLPDTDLTRAQVVANGLLRNVAATTVPGPRGPISTTVSIGLTITRPGETNLEGIVRRADIALYRAKEAGRNCVRVVLGDRDGNPIGGAAGNAPAPTANGAPRAVTLPFPDRRDPLRRDRRNVPSPGRRSTDRRPESDGRRPASGDAGTEAQPTLR